MSSLSAADLRAFLKGDIAEAQQQKGGRPARSKTARTHKRPSKSKPHGSKSQTPRANGKSAKKLVLPPKPTPPDARLHNRQAWVHTAPLQHVKMRKANSLDHDPGTMLKPKPYLLDPKKRIEKGGGYSPSYQILQLRKLRDARKQGDYATVQLMLKSFKRAVRNDHQEDWQLEDEAHENASTPMDTRRTMKFFTKPTGYTQPGVYVPNHRPEVSMKIAKNGPSTGKGLFMSGGTTPVYNMNDKPEQDEDSWLPTSISVQYDDEETCELAVGMAYPFALPDLQVHLEDDNKLVSKMDHVKQLYDKNNSSVAPSRRASTVQSGAGRKRSFSTRTRLPTHQQQGSGGVQRSQSKQNVHLDEMARIEAAADDYFGF